MMQTDNYLLDNLIGKPETEVLEACKGFNVRVWREGTVGTMDYRPTRLNLRFKNVVLEHWNFG
ncbi:hypothetical protein GM547_14710 [Streptococcus pneumoniae]|nr:hypothetical protein [Streptococcus pneumoniae]